MVACRPPSGTSGPGPLATPRPQPRRPRSSGPPRWQPELTVMLTPRNKGPTRRGQRAWPRPIRTPLPNYVQLNIVRCRHGRAWGSARSHPFRVRPAGRARGHRRGAGLPGSPAPDAAGMPGSPGSGVAQHGGGRAPSVPVGAADCRHTCRGLPRSPGPRRDRLAVAALSPVLLRSRLRSGLAPNLAGAPRRDHGRAWGGARRPPHVARPLRMRPRSDQGAAPLAGSPARPRRALRRLRGPLLVAGEGLETVLSCAPSCPTCRWWPGSPPATWPPSSCPVACSASASRATATPPEPVRRSGCATSRSGRHHRGARPLSDARRLQRRPAPLRGCVAGWACGCAARPGRRPLAPRRCIRRDGAGGLTDP